MDPSAFASVLSAASGKQRNPMQSRSAALAGAAQALNKPKVPGGKPRQDLSGATGGTIQGAHGGTQQLGDAAKRRLGGQADPNQSPPIVAPNQAGGGLNPDAQKPGNVGFTKPLALPGFMSGLPKADPGIQVFGGDAKIPGGDQLGGGGGVPPMPPELAQMLSERMGGGGGEMMGAGAPGNAVLTAAPGGAPGMSAGDSPDVSLGARLGGSHFPSGKLPGFGSVPNEIGARGPAGAYGKPAGGQSPLGVALGGGGMTIPGQPMNTKPMFNPEGGMQAPGPTDQPEDGGGIWGRIAGGGGRRNGMRNNMASY